MRLLPRKCDVTNIPTIFDDFFNNELFGNDLWQNSPTYPKVNLYEEPQAYHIEIAAPGWTKDQIQLSMENELLSIEANTTKEEEEGKPNEKYYRKEFMSSSFSRSFKIPDNLIDSENIHAEFTNGILHISLPKREQKDTTPSRIIDIE